MPIRVVGIPVFGKHEFDNFWTAVLRSVLNVVDILGCPRALIHLLTAVDMDAPMA
jgi:hypothetical protein